MTVTQICRRGVGIAVLTCCATTMAQRPQPLSGAEVDRFLGVVLDENAGIKERASAAQSLYRATNDKPRVATALEKFVEDPTKNLQARRVAVSTLNVLAQESSVGALAKAAAEKDSDLKGDAVAALMKLKAPGAKAVAQRLKEGDDEDRRVILTRLDSSSGGEMLAAFRELTGDKEAKVRLAALQGLLKMRRSSMDPATADLLVKLSNDDDAIVRATAARALSSMGALVGGKDTALLGVKLLTSDDPDVRVEGARIIGRSGVRERGAWTEQLAIVAEKDSSKPVREAATYFLAQMQPQDAGAMSSAKLIRDLGNPKASEEDRAMAMLEFASMDLIPLEAIPALITCLTDADPLYRANAARVLGNMGKDATAALPALEKARVGADAAMLAAIDRAVAMIGPSKKIELAPLLEKLKNPAATVRGEGIAALANAGAQAAPAMAALSEIAMQDAALEKSANQALEQINDAIGLTHGQGKIRMITSTDQAVAALSSPVMRERRLAMKKLRQLTGPPLLKVLGTLEKALKDEDHQVRADAAELLMRLGKEAGGTIPAVLPLLNDWSFIVRQAAVNALGQMGPRDAGVANAATTLLDARAAALKSEGIRLLVQSGPAAAPALPTLRAIGASESPLAGTARDAVKSIEVMIAREKKP